MSTYTYRIVTTPGIESVLVKELKLLGIKNVSKLKGRKIVEAVGPLKDLYKIIYKSRVAERVQLRPSKPILARGDKELNKNLTKVPWHAFLPISEFKKYKFPSISSKSFKSNLYHPKLIADIVKLHINELPVKKEYKSSSMDIGYKSFKKQFKNELRKENKDISQFKENLPENVNKDHIDNYRTKIEASIKRQEELLDLGTLHFINFK